MHVSSLDNMSMCIKRHILGDFTLANRTPLRVLDVGGADINGSYRQSFECLNCEYSATDMAEDSGPSITQNDPYTLPFSDQTFDVVISGQTIEHCEHFWLLFKEMVRVCKADGVLFLIAPSAGEIHRFPVDCYRFLPDSYQALAKYADVQLIDSWRDDHGPYRDMVGVFRSKGWSPTPTKSAPVIPLTKKQLQKEWARDPDPKVEAIQGPETTHSFIQRVHDMLQPRQYLEIGVFMGASLRMAKCPAIGIDPDPQVPVDHPLREKIVQTSSDEFFFEKQHESLRGKVDLVYIDGMHRIENVLKDFMNIEGICHPGTVIMLDDILPNHPRQARRERDTQYWTGDVWKIVEILRNHRPDLLLLPIDTSPTGTLLILGADPKNRTLWDLFDVVLYYWMKPKDPSSEFLTRKTALHPADPIIDQVLKAVRAAWQNNPAPRSIAPIKALYNDSLPRQIASLA